MTRTPSKRIAWAVGWDQPKVTACFCSLKAAQFFAGFGKLTRVIVTKAPKKRKAKK